MNLRKWRAVTFVLWIGGIVLLALAVLLKAKYLMLPAVALMLISLVVVEYKWRCPHCGGRIGQMSLKSVPNCPRCGKAL